MMSRLIIFFNNFTMDGIVVKRYWYNLMKNNVKWIRLSHKVEAR